MPLRFATHVIMKKTVGGWVGCDIQLVVCNVDDVKSGGLGTGCQAVARRLWWDSTEM